MSSRKRRTKQRPQGPQFTLDRSLQQEIAGLLLIAVGGLTVLALLSITKGSISEAWINFLQRIFGWGVYPVALAMIGGGLLFLGEELRKRVLMSPRTVFGLEVLFVALLGLSHLFATTEPNLQLAAEGKGGGYIGWTVSYFLVTAIGRTASFLILILAVGITLPLILSLDWDSFRATLGQVKVRLQSLTLPVEKADTSRASVTLRKKRKPRSRKPIVPPKAPIETKRVASVPVRRRRRDRRLPPLDLLNGGGNEDNSDTEVRYKKQVIEETLANFGVPAKVVEINQGPTVTQFGVEPGFVEHVGRDGKPRRTKVKVSKIMALQNDLALALAAAPIRVEAPVPGRSVVGIEVPNTKISLVSLRSVMESKAFRSMDSKLRIALGRDVAGQPVVADLGQMPHLLIAGATGSGKSVCIKSITACLLLNNTPDDLRLVMIDPKMVELTNFNGVSHLLAPVVTDVEEVIRALRWVTAQMDERYKQFSRIGARDIAMYNQMMVARGGETLPYIVVLIDELADLMMVASEEIERSICRIAQLARATGIHLVIATQRPSVDVVTGLIKANFPARISFTVSSQVDSRVILDTAGAEKLLGRGDMLYMASDSSKLVRLQGCFVSDEELERIVRFWRNQVDWIVAQPEATVPWRNLIVDEDSTDGLLEQAIELARERDYISTSFLQRRLRIGYPRAARLIDLMEESGIVGPAESAGRSRKVLINKHDFAGPTNGSEPGE